MELAAGKTCCFWHWFSRKDASLVGWNGSEIIRSTVSNCPGKSTRSSSKGWIAGHGKTGATQILSPYPVSISEKLKIRTIKGVYQDNTMFLMLQKCVCMMLLTPDRSINLHTWVGSWTGKQTGSPLRCMKNRLLHSVWFLKFRCWLCLQHVFPIPKCFLKMICFCFQPRPILNKCHGHSDRGKGEKVSHPNICG